MKTNQLILAAAALVVLASCTKSNVDPVNTAKTEGDEIGFNAVAKKATKANDAIISGATYATDNTFNVWGWHSEAGDFSEFTADAASNFMTGLKIEWTRGWKFASEDPEVKASAPDFAWRNKDKYYYWPFSGTISFLAIHPSTVAPTTTGWDATNDKPQATFADYTINNSNKTTDLMFATNASARRTDALTMVFKHALAQIEFYVKTDDDYRTDVQFDIESVQINGIDLSGDLAYANDNFTWTDNTNNTQTENWLYYNTVKENIYNYNLNNEEGRNSARYGAATLMIPQPKNVTAAAEGNPGDEGYVPADNTKTTLTIGYSMQQLPKASNAKITGTVTVDAPWAKVAPAAAIDGWEAGKKYNYILNFKLNEINFDPTVTDWVEVEMSTVDILD